jgi:hypothetical protein
MKTDEELEDLRNTIGGMVDMGEDGPFGDKRDMMAAVHNALCYVLEDGSPHAATFEKNWRQLLAWCEHNGVQFLKLHPTRQ